MYDIKALYEAASVDDAVELLQQHPEARIIAGGSDVLIQLREGRLADCELVSIQKLEELRGVELGPDQNLRIGAMTSFSHITGNSLIQQYIPVLGEAVDMVGGPQIRNIGTIGGNICNGVTSADSASTLAAWEAVLEITGPDGVRQLPIDSFYLQAGKVALAPAELLTAIIIPRASYKACYGHYIKYAMRNAMDIATLGCSVNVKLSADQRYVERVRIAYGVAGPVPMRAKTAEKTGNGQLVNAETVRKAALAAREDVNPRTSWRASRELRLHLIEELACRAFTEAIMLAGGEI